MEKRSFLTGSPSATQDLGKRIGERLGPGSVVALIGELGSGKTCFAKGLCAESSDSAIPSHFNPFLRQSTRIRRLPHLKLPARLTSSNPSNCNL
jgi:ABC-type hemin transport system ATPase subunit